MNGLEYTPPSFLSWLLVMGFFTETKYPKPGDFVLSFQDSEFKYVKQLGKDGEVEDVPEPRHFFFTLGNEELGRLYERFLESDR